MPSQSPFVPPLAGTPRPALPLEHLNPHIKSLDSSNLPAVKFQEIIREGQSTIVARMKVPTPAGHAFILRRLDTGAISLTTMFRAAFPTASDDSERTEANWVKANFDNTGGNRAGKARFAGTWVTTEVAISIANDYSLGKIIPPLTDAKPDPNTEYRKSSRAQQQQTPDKESPAPKQLPTPSPSMSTPNPPKRRREASPASTKAPSITSSSPTKSPLGATSTRRSQRTTSPAPSPTPKISSPKVASTMKSPKLLRSPLKTRRLEVVTPAGSDETAVEDEAPEVPGPDANEDIREQKEMIEMFKSQREAKLREQAAGDVDEAMDEGSERKRDREEENSLQFNFKEPETQERRIATNRRVARFPEMTPERRSFAWGIAAFAAAVGAMTYVPTPWF